MAIHDKLAEFGDDFDIAEAAGTLLFTNQIDLGAAGLTPGQGYPVYLVITITGGADGVITGGVAGTIQFALVSDDSASIHATTRSVHWLSKQYVTDDNALNELKKGHQIVVPLPYSDSEPYERYLGLQAIIATTTTTEGTASAYLTLTPPVYKSFADATN